MASNVIEFRRPLTDRPEPVTASYESDEIVEMLDTVVQLAMTQDFSKSLELIQSFARTLFAGLSADEDWVMTEIQTSIRRATEAVA